VGCHPNLRELADPMAQASGGIRGYWKLRVFQAKRTSEGVRFAWINQQVKAVLLIGIWSTPFGEWTRT
jgi:hypothetical protein